MKLLAWLIFMVFGGFVIWVSGWITNKVYKPKPTRAVDEAEESLRIVEKSREQIRRERATLDAQEEKVESFTRRRSRSKKGVEVDGD